MKLAATHPPVARPWISGLLVLLVLGVTAFASTGLLGGRAQLALPPLAARFAGDTSPSVAYGFSGGAIVKLDAATGAVLARRPYAPPTMLPSLAVSHDGRSVFVLDSPWDGTASHDRLTMLSAATLTPQASVPADAFAQDGAALAVTSDDRAVAIYHEHRFFGTAPDYWLTYFDRQTGQLLPAQTPLADCGSGGMLIPLAARLAVVCPDTGDVRIVDASAHRVVGTIVLDGAQGAQRTGRAVAAGAIPGAQALAVVLDDAQLLRVDLASQQVSQLADLAPGQWRAVPIDGAAFSPTGRAVIALSTDAEERALGRAGTLLVVDAATGRLVDRIAQASQYGVRISADGQRAFLHGQPSGGLMAVDLSTHRVNPFGAQTTDGLVFP